MFSRRQVVRSRRLTGPQFSPDWSEKAVIIGRHADLLDGNWYVVQFEHGGQLSAHAEGLMASNDPAFKGRLPTYAQTQR
jgi:hypothetical protein